MTSVVTRGHGEMRAENAEGESAAPATKPESWKPGKGCGIAIGVALLLCVVLWGIGKINTAANGIEVDGTVRLLPGTFATSGDDCTGIGAWNQFGPGGGIVVSGETTDSDEFGTGTLLANGQCEFTFSAKVLPADRYTFSVAGVPDHFVNHSSVKDGRLTTIQTYGP